MCARTDALKTSSVIALTHKNINLSDRHTLEQRLISLPVLCNCDINYVRLHVELSSRLAVASRS